MAVDDADDVDDGPYLFEDGEPWADVDIEELLERSQETQRERLDRELAQIERQLAERDRVHDEIVDELEWKIETYSDRLEHLYTLQKGRTDGTRDQLKERLLAFYRELREERREHWRDRQQLEQERREVRRELDAATDYSLSEFL
jgi:multidrug efflux pump subunit AcrA (membrane-fusion protein)